MSRTKSSNSSAVSCPADRLEFLEHLRAAVLGVGRDLGALHALELPQHVRHRGARQHDVVHAGRPRRSSVEAAQERVDVVGAAAARHQRQVRRRSPNQRAAVLRPHRVRHRVERPLAREHQVVDQLLLGDLQILRQAVVAHVLRRVAAEAIVHEVLRAALQRGDVGDVVVGGLELALRPARTRRRVKRRAPRAKATGRQTLTA